MYIMEVGLLLDRFWDLAVLELIPLNSSPLKCDIRLDYKKGGHIHPILYSRCNGFFF